MRRLAQPRTYSLGACLRDGHELPPAYWLASLGTEGPLEVRARVEALQEAE